MNWQIPLLCLFFFLSACKKDKPAFDSEKAKAKRDAESEVLIIDHAPKGKTSFRQSQIRLIFNKKMRSLGEQNDISKFVSVSPSVKCDYKWVSETTVVCEINGDLKRATKYSVKVKSGIKDIKGDKIKDDYSFEFETYPPSFVESRAYQEKALPKAELTFDWSIVTDKVQAVMICDKEEYPAALSPKEENKLQSSGLHVYFLAAVDPKIKKAHKDCYFTVKGKLATTDGPIEGTIDMVIRAIPPRDEKTNDWDELARTFSSISCRNSHWSNYDKKRFAREKVCPSGTGIKFQFQTEVGDEQKVEVIPPIGNMKLEKAYRGLEVNGDFQAGKTYTFRFPKGSGLIEDRYISIEFVDVPPSAEIKYRHAVIEKTGPHQIGVGAVNIDSFKVSSRYDNSPDEIARLAFDTKNLWSGSKKVVYKNETQLKTEQTELNQGVRFPLEIDNYGKGAGLYWLRLEDDVVPPKALEAHEKIAEATRYSYQSSIAPFSFSHALEVQVTDIGLHVKRGYLNTLVWAFDIPTGVPLKDVEIYAYKSFELKNRQMIKTDELGRAMFKGEAPSVFVAKKDDDISYVSNSNRFSNGIGYWAFNVNHKDIDDSKNFVVESIPDRPIYKSGDQVSLKFFIRKWDLESLTYLDIDSKTMNVKIRDSRGNIAHEENLELTEFSTASTRFNLKQDASLGTYRITVKPEGADRDFDVKGFKVEEYKLATFRVEGELDKSLYVVGDQMGFKGKSSYFFGGANKEADGMFVARFKQKVYRPKDDEFKRFRFHDANNYGYYDYYYGNVYESEFELSRQNFTTDDKGEFKAKADLNSISSSYLAGTVSAQMIIDGESGSKVATTKRAKFLNSTHVLGARFREWSYKDGSKISPEVVVLDQNENIKTGVELEYELIKQTWESVRRLGSGNYFYYDSNLVEETMGKCQFKSAKDFSACQIKVKGNGSYQSIIRGKDSEGRSIEVKNSTYVYGGDAYAGWNRYNHDRIDLLPDKYDYKLGDTAKILIKSPFQESTAMITIERYGVISSEIIEIKGNTHVYELPIDKSIYAPGIYVSAVLLKGRTSDKVEGDVDLGKPAFKIGYTKLSVEDKELHLNVKTEMSKERVLPGEEVTLTVEVEDLKEKSQNFELAIAVVDEAVLQLTSNYRQRYQLFETFYEMPSLEVLNFQTLIGLVGRQTYGKKGGTPGGGGGAGVEIRDEFLAVAHWEPHLKTDDKGMAKLTFKVPDNLTTWKVLVVAVDKTRKFGLGIDDFMATKDLIVEPVLPAFLTEGDKLNSKLVVHNKTEKNLSIKTSLEARGIKPERSEKTIDVAGGGKGGVQFPIQVENSGKYELILKGESGSVNDGLKYDLEVIPLETKFVEGLFGTTTEKSSEIPFMVPSDIKNGSQEIEMRVSSTLLTGLRDSFQYVLQYPYGCWEQRMTRAMYLAFYEKLRPLVGKIGDGFPESKTRIQELLNLAPKYMGANGGMKYYPSDYGEVSPYLSTFTGLSFFVLEGFGYSVPSEAKKGLGEYLKEMLKRDRHWLDFYDSFVKDSNKAMIAFVLDQWGESGLDGDISNLVNKFERLSLFGKSFLIRLMAGKGKYKETAKNQLANLVSQMDVSSAKASFPIDKKSLYSYYLDTSMRSQCAMLSTLLNADSGNEVVPKLQNFIDKSRKGGRWYNTQENFFCFMAFYDYSKIYEKDSPKFSVRTIFNGKDVNESSLDLKTTKGEFPVDIRSIAPGKKSKIDLEKSGTGRLYYNAWLKYAKAELPKERVNQGFGIEKTMYRFNEQSGKWEKLPQEMNLKVGEIVRVRILVDAKGRRTHVGVNDPLAGCFTAINTNLATTATGSKAFTTKIDNSDRYMTMDQVSWNSAFRFMDMRKTAVQFYAPSMRPGTYGVQYDLRVTASGEFTQNAVSVEEMYYPDVRGTGLGRKIVVTD